MIAVIADDLSGAAELASVAAGFGLRTEVQTQFEPRSDADVIAIDTDSRSLPEDRAAKIVGDAARALLPCAPEWIYKKTDSVLRGNVRAEIEAILDGASLRRALLIPANPSKNRVIRGGVYLVNGTPLAETEFARDPEHPRRSSSVRELLGLADTSSRIDVPDIASAEDVAMAAGRVDATILPAGAVDFFESLLSTKSPHLLRKPPEEAFAPLRAISRTLFVCGSAAAWDRDGAHGCSARGIPVITMPKDLFKGEPVPASANDWRQNVAIALRDHGRAMLAIGRPSTEISPLPQPQLLAMLTEAVADGSLGEGADCICLEGGATAAAFCRRFGWTRMTALPTPWAGIAALKPATGPLLLIKPGSYPWPGGNFP